MDNWTNEVLRNQIDREPKEIFEAYCEELGRYFSKKKFKFFRSGPRIERNSDGIVESINFWSSKINVKNEYVHLEILPYVKSKSLKKWIKTNQIGRNEFLYSLKIDYPRNLGIFGHSFKDFQELLNKIDINVVSKLEEFKVAISNSKEILETDRFDQGIIADNYLAYLCMNNPELVQDGLNKYGNKLSLDTKSRIIEKVKAC